MSSERERELPQSQNRPPSLRLANHTVLFFSKKIPKFASTARVVSSRKGWIVVTSKAVSLLQVRRSDNNIEFPTPAWSPVKAILLSDGRCGIMISVRFGTSACSALLSTIKVMSSIVSGRTLRIILMCSGLTPESTHSRCKLGAEQIVSL